MWHVFIRLLQCDNHRHCIILHHNPGPMHCLAFGHKTCRHSHTRSSTRQDSVGGGQHSAQARGTRCGGYRRARRSCRQLHSVRRGFKRGGYGTHHHAYICVHMISAQPLERACNALTGACNVLSGSSVDRNLVDTPRPSACQSSSACVSASCSSIHDESLPETQPNRYRLPKIQSYGLQATRSFSPRLLRIASETKANYRWMTPS